MIKKAVNLLVIILPMIVLFLAVSQYILSNSFILQSEEIGQIDERISLLANQNEIMLEQVSRARSIAVLNQYAEANGFIKPVSIISISKDIPVALKTE